MSCITVLPFCSWFPEKVPHWNLLQNRTHNIAVATTASLPVSTQHQPWVLAILDSCLLCVNGGFSFLGLGSHHLETCSFQWKLTHHPWPLWSPFLLSKSLFSCTFLYFWGGGYYSLSQRLVSLKSGVTCNSLFHPKRWHERPRHVIAHISISFLKLYPK